MEHVYKIYTEKVTESPHKILKELRRRIPQRSPRQLREHHGRMIKKYGSVAKMLDEYAPHDLHCIFSPMLEQMDAELQDIRRLASGGAGSGASSRQIGNLSGEVRCSRLLAQFRESSMRRYAELGK